MKQTQVYKHTYTWHAHNQQLVYTTTKEDMVDDIDYNHIFYENYGRYYYYYTKRRKENNRLVYAIKLQILDAQRQEYMQLGASIDAMTKRHRELHHDTAVLARELRRSAMPTIQQIYNINEQHAVTITGDFSLSCIKFVWYHPVTKHIYHNDQYKYYPPVSLTTTQVTSAFRQSICNTCVIRLAAEDISLSIIKQVIDHITTCVSEIIDTYYNTANEE